jgi:hypothetical protein
MPNSFRYLLAVTGLVALLFAAISAWPLLSSWMRARTAPQPVPPPIVARPYTPQSTNAGTQSSRNPAIHTQVRPLPSPGSALPSGSALPATATNVRPVSSSPSVPGNWTTGDGEDNLGFCVARDTLTLYNRPEGDPLVPVSLNRSPLSVSKGTRLGMIRQEGKWLLVHSTFATTGWVHERLVSEVEKMSTLQ